jgi:hypothetical protein
MVERLAGKMMCALKVEREVFPPTLASFAGSEIEPSWGYPPRSPDLASLGCFRMIRLLNRLQSYEGIRVKRAQESGGGGIRPRKARFPSQ